MESSRLLARIVNLVSPVARTSNVCPPLTSRFKNGNSGGVGSVRRGVKACACFPRGQISGASGGEEEERTMWWTPTMGLSIIPAMAFAAWDPHERQPYIPGPTEQSTHCKEEILDGIYPA